MQSMPQKGTLCSYCMTKSTTELVSDNHLNSSFLDTVDTVSDQPETSWMLHLQLNSKSISFKLDTGAEVTAISPDTRSCINSVELRPPKKPFVVPLV